MLCCGSGANNVDCSNSDGENFYTHGLNGMTMHYDQIDHDNS